MSKTYRVTLTPEERAELSAKLSAGREAARVLTRARVLLKVDEGADGPAWSDRTIADAFEVSARLVERLRQRFVEHGLLAALRGRPKSRVYRPILGGEQEAQLIALACSKPPVGQRQWSLRLLADQMVELKFVERVSYETVRRTLKKTGSAPGRSGNGSSRRSRARILSVGWKTYSTSTSDPTTPVVPSSVLTRPAPN